MTLLAALVIPLHPAEDIAVGSPIANRNRSEIEGLIGFLSTAWYYAPTSPATQRLGTAGQGAGGNAGSLWPPRFAFEKLVEASRA